jgi:hypothetical protein
MLNIKKAITVSKIFLHNLISLSLFLALFCLPGHLYAQMPPALDFPPERELDPRYPRVPGEIGGQATGAPRTDSPVLQCGGQGYAISENVEFVGTTGGVVYDVFVFASLSSLLRKPPGQLRLCLRWRSCNPRRKRAF